ncbi:MAG: FtsX-like permease family protein [Firmicutes bacterium]|nr:FtsX-like permease family protein [Bacillota bacterium]
MLTLFRRKERLFLVLLGILLVSLAAGLSASTARSIQGTVDEELAQHWRTDYDILVRPHSAVSEIEKADESVSSKFQSNHFSDHEISVLQLEAIRDIEGVEVAAPLAVVGPAYVQSGVGVPMPYDNLEPGVYKEVITVTESNGIENIKTSYTSYFISHDSFMEFGTEYDEIPISLFYNAGLSIPPYRFSAMQFTINVVAVDLEAEAALHGLDRALIEGDLPSQGGNYRDGEGQINLPIILNQYYGPEGNASVSLSRLTEMTPRLETVEMLADTDRNLFRQAKEEHVKDFDLNLEVPLTLPGFGETFAQTEFRAPEGLEYSDSGGEIALFSHTLGGSLSLDPLNQDVTGRYELGGRNQVFRRPAGDDRPGSLTGGTIQYSYAGTFDPELLSVMESDSPVAAPLEIYRSSPEIVLSGLNGAPVPPETYARFVHAYDFVGAPIGGLVPLEATDVLGDVGIDSVRVRVSGVDDMSEESQLRIAYIAQQIEERTGLHADIVLGSSQQRKPVHLYSYNNAERENYLEYVVSALQDSIQELELATGMPTTIDFYTLETDMRDWFLDTEKPMFILPRGMTETEREELLSVVMTHLEKPLAELGYEDLSNQYQQIQYNPYNWHKKITVVMPEYQMADGEPRDLYGVVEQHWIKLGTHIRIYEETNRGTFWITLGLLAVGTLFIGNTTYISAVGRIGEFSALRSLGWRRSTVFRVSLTETLLVALLAGITTATVLALVWMFSERYLDSMVLLLVAPAVLVTFLIGGIPPLIRTIFIPPLAGVRQGELKSKSRIGGAHPLGFILRGLTLRLGRTFVTLLAMIIPAGMLAFSFFVYFGVQSLMGETLLGEYLALEFRGYHFVLNGLIFAVAGLAVTDALLMNLRERQKELGLLKAIGWRNNTVSGLLFCEGVSLGLVGGVIGTVAAGFFYMYVFGLLPPKPLLNGLLLVLLPALVGGLAALVPAGRAKKIPAAQVIREE